MNPQKLLGATMLGSLAVATVGAGKFPPPHRYTGVLVLWFLLGLVAQMGAQAARFCAALSGLVMLAMAMGQGGKRALAWLQGVGPRLGVERPSAPGTLVAKQSMSGVAGVGGVIAAAERLSTPTGRTRPRR